MFPVSECQVEFHQNRHVRGCGQVSRKYYHIICMHNRAEIRYYNTSEKRGAGLINCIFGIIISIAFIFASLCGSIYLFRHSGNRHIYSGYAVPGREVYDACDWKVKDTLEGPYRFRGLLVVPALDSDFGYLAVGI